VLLAMREQVVLPTLVSHLAGLPCGCGALP